MNGSRMEPFIANTKQLGGAEHKGLEGGGEGLACLRFEVTSCEYLREIPKGMRTRRQSTIKKDLFEYELDAYDLNSSLSVINRSTILDWQPCKSVEQYREMPSLGNFENLPSGDPLDVKLFLGYHKRLEKEEKRAMEIDRIRVVSGADKILEQQNILQGPYWQRGIANIVKIDNIHDSHELRTKRKLALEEIATFVARFNKMERERKIKQRRYTEPSQEKRPARIKRKSVHTPRVATASPPVLPAPTKVWIYIAPRAFGVCIPELSFRPRIFDIPESWKPSSTREQT